MRGDEQVAAECLRGLRLPQFGARDGRDDCAVGDALQSVGDRYRGDCAAGAGGGDYNA